MFVSRVLAGGGVELWSSVFKGYGSWSGTSSRATGFDSVFPRACSHVQVLGTTHHCSYNARELEQSVNNPLRIRESNVGYTCDDCIQGLVLQDGATATGRSSARSPLSFQQLAQQL